MSEPTITEMINEPQITEITDDEPTVTEIIESEKKEHMTKQERNKMKRLIYKKKKAEKKREELKTRPIKEEFDKEAFDLQKIGKANLEKWNGIYKMIVEYKEKFGKFPNMRSNGREVNDQAAKVLGRWLWLQQSCQKNGNMHPYHQRQLEEIGFKF